MAAEAIALVVVGSGEVSDNEVNDLFDDAYGEVEELGLIVPVDKDLYTEAVESAVDWYNNDKDVYPVRTKGSSLSRKSSKLGPEDPDEYPDEVDKFSDFLDPDEFKDWDEVHVVIAMPKEEDEDEYDFYADIADVALQAGFKVMDLTAGLDDIEIKDDEEPEEEPEPEPVKEEPPKRARSRKKTEEPKADTVQQIREELEGKPKAEPISAPVPEPVVNQRLVHEALLRVSVAVADLAALYAPSEAPAPVKDSTPLESEKDAPKTSSRGRGRPRTRFEVKQVWDEDEEEWVARPAGRLSKGTKWRTIHAETGETLDEGTA